MAPLEQEAYADVATVFHPDPAQDEHWAELGDLFAYEVLDSARAPIDRIFEIVRSRACRTIVLERDYVDRDYLSEYSAFWASRFADRPVRAARVHFFAREFGVDDLHDLPQDVGYLGYFVFRPTPLGAIGRTVLVPPASLTGDEVRLTEVVDRPSLFGNPLEVRGVPFCQQDGVLLRCAHAAAWICHFVAHHRRIIGRKATADIATMSSVEGSKHRPLPSTGLTGEQLQGVFSAVGIPAFFYEVEKLPKLPADLPDIPELSAEEQSRRVLDERIFRVVCKYLNSGFPVVVLTESEDENHAFTLVGWESLDDEGGVRLIACDDQVGPYEIIDSPTVDGAQRGTWKGFMLPLPKEVFLTGEAAESRARQYVRAAAQSPMDDDVVSTDFAEIAPHLDDLRGKVRVRSRLIEGRRYKAMAKRQRRHPDAIRVLRMANYPLWVWVVEFQDPVCRKAREPCVMAEVIFDSSAHDDAPDFELISTQSATIDVEMVDSEEMEQLAPAGAEGDEAVDEGTFSWFGRTDGRKWRSLVSDPTVSDREYGGSSAKTPRDE